MAQAPKGEQLADFHLMGQRKGKIMAFITTKSVIVASFVAAAGSGAGMASYHAHPGGTQPAPAQMAGIPGIAADSPDWSGQWYSVQRFIREGEPETGPAPTF